MLFLSLINSRQWIVCLSSFVHVLELTLLQDIISGYDKFNEILNLHKEVRFPAVYLGLALMFQKLNRYEQALINAEKGVEWFDNNLPCLTYR